MSTLGSRIKESRIRKDLLQSDLAKLVDAKSSAVISNWEKDVNKPDADKLVLLCKALDVTGSYLLGCDSPSELSTREKELLSMFREVGEEAKQRIESALSLECQQYEMDNMAEADGA